MSSKEMASPCSWRYAKLLATRELAGTARPAPLVMVFDTEDFAPIKKAVDLGAAGYFRYPFDSSALKKATVTALGAF